MTNATTIQKRQASVTRLLLAPGIIWMMLFLVLPILMIIYVSFWTQTTFKIEPTLTLKSWVTFFSSDTYLGALWTTIRIWLIASFSLWLAAAVASARRYRSKASATSRSPAMKAAPVAASPRTGIRSLSP